MTPSRVFLALFLSLLSLHLGLSMQLPLVTWIGTALSVVGVFRLVQLERPTWGLLFVLFISGIFLGNQVLEDWAIEGSWPQTNGLGAGFILSLLVYLLWLFLATPPASRHHGPIPLERDSQSILVWGLLLMLLLAPPPSATWVTFGVEIAPVTIGALFLACLVLICERCSETFSLRILLLAPLLLVVPLLMLILKASQEPVIAALGDLFPRSSNFTPTGFSPSQQLRASVFLRPSNRAVMRIQAEAPPNTYLAGNRLAMLDDELTWQPVDRPLVSITAFDAEALPSGDYRYPVGNHQAPNLNAFARDITIHSLTNDNYIFIAPGMSHVVGRFGSMLHNAADVWTPAFERGTDRRWQLEAIAPPTPEDQHPAYLQLPEFWDESLQQRSNALGGDSTMATVNNVLAHFQTRPYSLSTNFDPDAPFHDFFLNERAGYCFWFATATTLALRANNIPARLVGGYVIHEQLTSNLWLVRERDAHSWVEWQDENGFWHTIDPTPPAIFGFFNGYESSALSQWYHALAGQWQILIDQLLADEFMSNLVIWGGLAILAFLFVREYRRIQQARTVRYANSQHWQKLWQIFIRKAKLPDHSYWTASTYAENLPEQWSEELKESAREFLRIYNHARFSRDNTHSITDAEQSLEKWSRNATQ